MKNLLIDSFLTPIVESTCLNVDMCNLNKRKKMKAEPNRLIPRKFTENLELLIVVVEQRTILCCTKNTSIP